MAGIFALSFLMVKGYSFIYFTFKEYFFFTFSSDLIIFQRSETRVCGERDTF